MPFTGRDSLCGGLLGGVGLRVAVDGLDQGVERVPLFRGVLEALAQDDAGAQLQRLDAREGVLEGHDGCEGGTPVHLLRVDLALRLRTRKVRDGRDEETVVGLELLSHGGVDLVEDSMLPDAAEAHGVLGLGRGGGLENVLLVAPFMSGGTLFASSVPGEGERALGGAEIRPPCGHQGAISAGPEGPLIAPFYL